MTDSQLVDKFFREPHADGVTFYAQRGKTRVEAVDWDEETDRLYPIVPEIERAKNRDWGFEEIDREQIPDRIEEFLKDQFMSSEELSEAINSVGTPEGEGGA